MKVKIEAKQEKITLIADSGESDLFILISAFGGDAIIFPRKTKGFLDSLSSKFVKKIVIDMNHPNISKEFIQMLLRLK